MLSISVLQEIVLNIFQFLLHSPLSLQYWMVFICSSCPLSLFVEWPSSVRLLSAFDWVWDVGSGSSQCDMSVVAHREGSEVTCASCPLGLEAKEKVYAWASHWVRAALGPSSPFPC